MCKALLFNLPCTNFKCPNNLFWKDLKLNREKIRMTERALEIRNCCCLIRAPWTSEEISNAWGLTKEEIRRSEEEAFKKLERKVLISRKRSQSTAPLN
jgi:DNA-directed RNA polymerase sigma subunit (sigma70/sigma32)